VTTNIASDLRNQRGGVPATKLVELAVAAVGGFLEIGRGSSTSVFPCCEKDRYGLETRSVAKIPN